MARGCGGDEAPLLHPDIQPVVGAAIPELEPADDEGRDGEREDERGEAPREPGTDSGVGGPDLRRQAGEAGQCLGAPWIHVDGDGVIPVRCGDSGDGSRVRGGELPRRRGCRRRGQSLHLVRVEPDQHAALAGVEGRLARAFADDDPRHPVAARRAWAIGPAARPARLAPDLVHCLRAQPLAQDWQRRAAPVAGRAGIGCPVRSPLFRERRRAAGTQEHRSPPLARRPRR